MAIVNLLSSVETDLANNQKANGNLDRATVKSTMSVVAVNANDNATSTYKLVRLPSNAYLRKVVIYNDALTGGTQYNVGVAGVDGTTTTANLFATNTSFVTASKNGTNDVRFSNLSLATIDQPLWQLMGLSTDGGGYYDLTITAVTPSTVAGNIAVIVDYATH